MIYDVQHTYDYTCSGKGAYEESFGEVLDDIKRYDVMEFVGLDKNKKDIYEGDIVIYEISCYGEHGLTTYDSTERYPKSVWKFAKDIQKSALHPTQKPLALCEYMVKTYTNEGDLVLDSCMGSNTTGLACKNLKRRYIGIEKDKDIFKIAVERTEE